MFTWTRLHALFWPDLFILGGAISEHFAQYAHLLHSQAEIRPAVRRPGRRRRRGARCRRRLSAAQCPPQQVARVGTTIFTVMSRRARELGAINLGQGFPDYDIDPRLSELAVRGDALRATTSTRPCRGSRSCVSPSR